MLPRRCCRVSSISHTTHVVQVAGVDVLQPAPAPALLDRLAGSRGSGGNTRSLKAPVRAKMPPEADCPLSNPNLPSQARQSFMSAAVRPCLLGLRSGGEGMCAANFQPHPSVQPGVVPQFAHQRD